MEHFQESGGRNGRRRDDEEAVSMHVGASWMSGTESIATSLCFKVG
jgi:hypothetical protein